VKVLILRDVNVKVTAAISRGYRSGTVVTVLRSVGDELIRQGAAQPLAPKKPMET